MKRLILLTVMVLGLSACAHNGLAGRTLQATDAKYANTHRLPRYLQVSENGEHITIYYAAPNAYAQFFSTCLNVDCKPKPAPLEWKSQMFDLTKNSDNTYDVTLIGAPAGRLYVGRRVIWGSGDGDEALLDYQGTLPLAGTHA